MEKIHTFIDRYEKNSLSILRISLGIVFIYFGWTSIVTPQMWAGFVPAWTHMFLPALTLVQLHGISEVAFGLLLIMGIQTRVVAFFLFFDLLHILTLLDFGPVWMRDLGLTGAMLSLIFSKRDSSF
jgi:uncharacterized membrane protein YphA (DoxX/SURF4 family)